MKTIRTPPETPMGKNKKQKEEEAKLKLEEQKKKEAEEKAKKKSGEKIGEKPPNKGGKRKPKNNNLEEIESNLSKFILDDNNAQNPDSAEYITRSVMNAIERSKEQKNSHGTKPSTKQSGVNNKNNIPPTVINITDLKSENKLRESLNKKEETKTKKAETNEDKPDEFMYKQEDTKLEKKEKKILSGSYSSINLPGDNFLSGQVPDTGDYSFITKKEFEEFKKQMNKRVLHRCCYGNNESFNKDLDFHDDKNCIGYLCCIHNKPILDIAGNTEALIEKYKDLKESYNKFVEVISNKVNHLDDSIFNLNRIVHCGYYDDNIEKNCDNNIEKTNFYTSSFVDKPKKRNYVPMDTDKNTGRPRNDSSENAEVNMRGYESSRSISSNRQNHEFVSVKNSGINPRPNPIRNQNTKKRKLNDTNNINNNQSVDFDENQELDKLNEDKDNAEEILASASQERKNYPKGKK